MTNETKPADYVTLKGERWHKRFGYSIERGPADPVGDGEIIAELLAQHANAKRLFDVLSYMLTEDEPSEGWLCARTNALRVLEELRPIYTEGAR